MTASPKSSASTAASDLPDPSAPAPPPSPPPKPPAPPPAKPSRRKWLLFTIIGVALLAAAYFGWPTIDLALHTISTDDAYVNGHVTFVAPRVSGQVAKVLVDDNYRVKKGDVLVQLDPEPYQIRSKSSKRPWRLPRPISWRQRASHGYVGQARADRYNLAYAIEQVNDKIAVLRASVATYDSHKAELELARSNLRRAEELAPSGGISKEDLDIRRANREGRRGQVEESLQAIYANRASLGLPTDPRRGRTSAKCPPNLDQNFSTVREALAQADRERRTDWLFHILLGRHAGPSDRRLLQARPQGRPGTHLCADHSQRAADQAGRGTTAAGPPRSGTSGTQSPLLQRRQRDRRRGDPPQCESRQQRAGGRKPDGGPLADRNLDRRQFQRNATRPTCGSASGRAAKSTCMAAGTSSRAASPASRWAPAKRSPCCRRKTRPATSSKSSSGCRCASS